MGYSCYPESGLRWWHVVVFLGFVVLVVDIATINTMGSKTNQYPFANVPARPAPPAVEVPVATKDLPVGTVFTDEKLWSTKKVPQENVPSGAAKGADLLNKLLLRPVRAGEVILEADLSRGLQMPEGTDLVSIAFISADPRFVPGAHLDVVASFRDGEKPKVFELLVNVLLVNGISNIRDKNADPEIEGRCLVLTKKQATALELARERGCDLSLVLRNDKKNADAGKDHDIDAVIKRLSALPAIAPPPRPVSENR